MPTTNAQVSTAAAVVSATRQARAMLEEACGMVPTHAPGTGQAAQCRREEQRVLPSRPRQKSLGPCAGMQVVQQDCEGLSEQHQACRPPRTGPTAVGACCGRPCCEACPCPGGGAALKPGAGGIVCSKKPFICSGAALPGGQCSNCWAGPLANVAQTGLCERQHIHPALFELYTKT